VAPASQFAIDNSEFGFNIKVGGGLHHYVTPRQRIGLGALFQIIQVGSTTADFVTLGIDVMWMTGAK
jgi:hypothetical protein